MRFLSKKKESEIEIQNLLYRKSSDREKIRQILINEQHGFCAYSERYLRHTDSVDIEHFDPRLKNTLIDGYYNWYGVLNWMNTHKAKKIEPYLPILLPYAENLHSRINYRDGIYAPVDENDKEAENLISFLGFNRQELVQDRELHISRIKKLKELCAGDTDMFYELLSQHKEYLSFSTALKDIFDIDVEALIRR